MIEAHATIGDRAAEPCAAAVRCGTHGPMNFDFARKWWTCQGFDGEGCPALLTLEDSRRVTSNAPPGTVFTEIVIRKVTSHGRV